MVNPDLLISVGIWLCGLGMTLIGIETTVRPPNEQTKWWYRGIFAVLGITFIGLSILQFDRADKENKRQAQEHLQEQVRNEGNLKYMQGQLDSINKVLGTLSSNANSSQTAAIFRSLITGMPQVLGPGQSALGKMSNKQLRSRVLEFVARLRDLGTKYNQQEQQSTSQWEAEITKLARTDMPANTESFQRMTQRSIALSNQFQADYKSLFAADALSYRDELIRRLGPQLPISTGTHVPLSLDGWIAPMSVDATATYLEILAKKFPD